MIILGLFLLEMHRRPWGNKKMATFLSHAGLFIPTVHF